MSSEIFIDWRWFQSKNNHKLISKVPLFVMNICILLYITNLVCYTYFHWLFNPECQHIFGKETGYTCTFSVSLIGAPKNNNKVVDKNRNIYASLNQYHNTNNKCIFTKLNAVFNLKTVVWTKKISTPTTQFVQRVQLSSEETVQWHKLWQLPDTNLPRQLLRLREYRS